MNNFHPRHRGKIVGILDASFSGGPALFSALYGTIYAAGHVKDEANQNLGGFYLMTAICFAVVGALGIIFLRPYSYEATDEDVTTIVNADELNEPISSYEPPSKQKDITGLRLVKRFDFHYLLWGYIFCAGLQLMFQSNQQTYLKSFSLETYTTIFTVINPIAGIVSKFFAGFLSDAIHHKVPRAAVLLAFNVIQTVCLAISIFFSDKLGIFAIVNIVIGFANGALWCLTPTMISEFYGMKYFPRNWGAMMLGNAFGGLALSELFGWIYKSNITDPDSTDCYGLQCFTWSWIMAAALSLNSVILEVGLLQKKLDEKKYEGEDPNVEMCCPGPGSSHEKY